MSLTNKVAQFDTDSDLVNAWVHGPATGAGSTITTNSGTVDTPAKLIATTKENLQDFILGNFSLLPTAATGLASGFLWVDVAAGNVLKRVP